MALTINAQISGQEATSTPTFCYLYEPLFVKFYDSGISSSILYIDTYRLSSDGLTKTNVFDKHVYYPAIGGDLDIDLMELMRTRTDILSDLPRASTYLDLNRIQVTDQYKVGFDLYSDDPALGVIEIKKTLIYGARDYQNFTPAVSQGDPLTEFDKLGVDTPSFIGFPKFTNALLSPTASITSTVTTTIPNTGRAVCGAYLIWKSRYGGYVGYGFDIYQENVTTNYGGDIDSNLFNPNSSFNGDPYIKPDYNKITNKYNVQLKALSVGIDEARALKGLQAAKFVWIMRESDSKLELMRVNSVAIPFNNLSNGSDVSVNLSSISVNNQYTI